MNCCSGLSFIHSDLDQQSNKKININKIRICSVEVAGFPVALGKSTLIYILGQNLKIKDGFSKLDLHCVSDTMCLLNPQKNHIVVFLDDVLNVAQLPLNVSVLPCVDKMSDEPTRSTTTKHLDYVNHASFYYQQNSSSTSVAAAAAAAAAASPSPPPSSSSSSSSGIEHVNVVRFKSLAQSNVPPTDSNSLYNNLLRAFQAMCYAQNSLAAAYNQQISCVVSEITSRYSNLLVGDSKITLVFSRRIVASMALFTMGTVLRQFPLLLPMLKVLGVEGDINSLAQVQDSYEHMADEKHPCWGYCKPQLKNSDLCNLSMMFTHFVKPFLNVNLLQHVNYGHIYHEGVFDLEMFLLKHQSGWDRSSLLEKCFINMSQRGRKFEKEFYPSREEFCKFFNLYTPHKDVYMKILSDIVSTYETRKICCTEKPFDAASVERGWDRLNDVEVDFKNEEELMKYVIRALSKHFVCDRDI